MDRSKVFSVYKVVREIDGENSTVSVVFEDGSSHVIARPGIAFAGAWQTFATPAVKRTAPDDIVWILSDEPYRAGKKVSLGYVAFLDSFEIEGN